MMMVFFALIAGGFPVNIADLGFQEPFSLKISASGADYHLRSTKSGLFVELTADGDMQWSAIRAVENLNLDELPVWGEPHRWNGRTVMFADRFQKHSLYEVEINGTEVEVKRPLFSRPAPFSLEIRPQLESSYRLFLQNDRVFVAPFVLMDGDVDYEVHIYECLREELTEAPADLVLQAEVPSRRVGPFGYTVHFKNVVQYDGGFVVVWEAGNETTRSREKTFDLYDNTGRHIKRVVNNQLTLLADANSNLVMLLDVHHMNRIDMQPFDPDLLVDGAQ